MYKPLTYKNKQLLGNARELRLTMTSQERHLWYDFLRHYPVKVFKQRIIDNYIVDFYCHEAKLVIELDGLQHYTPEARNYDKARTESFEKYGISVIRFSNRHIDESFESVCRMIDKAICERCSNGIKP